jgi:glucosamine-6-phosphate deaminase
VQIELYKDADALGRRGAELVLEQLGAAIAQRGEAVLLGATGASQEVVLSSLAASDFAWDRVTILHLDEYVGISDDHPASIRRCLRERLIDRIHPKQFIPIEGEKSLPEVLHYLDDLVAGITIDAALVGVGENAHIAFNDPPADFEAAEPFRVVTLDRRSKEQQVREGQFPSADRVPTQAITMTVPQILRSSRIVSCVPFQVKAPAIRDLLAGTVTNMVPATALCSHSDVWFLLDQDSASQTPPDRLAAYDAREV